MGQVNTSMSTGDKVKECGEVNEKDKGKRMMKQKKRKMFECQIMTVMKKLR